MAEVATPDPLDDGEAVARLRSLLVRSPGAFAFVRDGRFSAVSEAFNHVFDHGDHTDLTGVETRCAFATTAVFESLSGRLSAAFAQGRPCDEELELVRRDGARFWGRVQVTPVHWDHPGTEQLWIVSDVTAARQQRMMPTWAARHDPVTELANRREFERRLSEHVGSRRNEPVSVLWLDVDRFRAIEEGMGHEVGNHFLLGLGQLLQSKVRATDVVARMEDDHFAVLLTDCDQHFAQIVAEKIRGAVAGYRLRWGLHRAKVRASVGVVQLHTELPSVEATLAAATSACQEAKQAGGDSVRVHVTGAASH